MIAKFLSPPLALVLFAGTAAAQPAPKPLDDKKLVTKVYDIRSLLGERGKANGVADADAILKVIFEALPQFHALKPGTDGPQLIERGGGKLEVRATAQVQSEVKDLLDALERLVDLAVDIKSEVIELDAAAFEKYQKAVPKVGRGKAGSPIIFATSEGFEENRPNAAEQKALGDADKILKAGRVVQTSTDRFSNGIEATLSARLSVLTFHNQVVNDNAAGAPQFVKEGFRLVGRPIVSADRRFVRLKLTEQSVAITRMKRVEAGEIVNKQRLVLQSPETEDLGATGSTVVEDGGTAIFRLAYAPKDKVWVVVVKLTIFIQAEEEELKKEGQPIKP